MSKPRVVLLTGAPGSGKSALGRELAIRLRLPFIARDDVRGGLLFSAGAWTDRLDRVPPGDEAVEAFLRAVESLLASDVSCIVEYVVRRDRPDHFDRIAEAGDCVVVITSCGDPTSRVRTRTLADPLLSNPAVLDAVAASSIEEHAEVVVERMRTVAEEMRTSFPVPVLTVATDDVADPSLDQVIAFVTAPRQTPSSR